MRLEIKFKNILEMIIITATIGMHLVNSSTIFLSYFIISLYSTYGHEKAIKALALVWLISMLNPGIVSESNFASVGRYFVIMVAATSILFRSKVIIRRTPIKPITLATLLLGLFFLVHSFIFSPIVDVSVFKITSWTVVMTSLVAAWAGLAINERERLVRHIFYGLIIVMLISLPFLILPLGYLRNDSGFQGVLNHPQVFGSTMALLCAWSASRMLGQRQPPWSALALVIICFTLVLLSETRTAGLALVLGVSTAVFAMSVLSGLPVRIVLPGLKSKRFHLIGALTVVALTLNGPMLADSISYYISKSGRSGATTVAEAYERSRGPLILKMWSNIQEQPLQGIGFGIASDPEFMTVQRDPFLGLPASAPVEKGVLPLAVLEEVGIIGFAAVTVWILLLLRRSAHAGVTPLAITLTALLLNMGEATLFSPGGFGLISLILYGWAFSYKPTCPCKPGLAAMGGEGNS